MYEPNQYDNKQVDNWKDWPPYNFTKYNIPTIKERFGIIDMSITPTPTSYLSGVGISVTEDKPTTITYNGQTKKHSLYETIWNICIGFVVAMLAQLIIFPLYHIHIPFNHNLQIGGWMTLVSLIRSYGLRRWFNKLTIEETRS